MHLCREESRMDRKAVFLLLTLGLFLLLILISAFLLFLAVMVPDTAMIRNRPFQFVFEWIVLSVGVALPFYVFVYTRGMDWATATAWFIGLSVKLAVLHVLFDLSGYYSYLFEGKTAL